MRSPLQKHTGRLGILTILLLIYFPLIAQKTESSNELKITGAVKNPTTISYLEIAKKQPVAIGDLTITSHTGDFRKKYKNLKGVPLLELVRDVQINAPSPKDLSSYYLVLSATDNYSVVISWNELFNTEIGKTFFIVTEIDGTSMKESPESILMIAAKDFRTGRRHIKGLSTIEIRKL